MSAPAREWRLRDIRTSKWVGPTFLAETDPDDAKATRDLLTQSAKKVHRHASDLALITWIDRKERSITL